MDTTPRPHDYPRLSLWRKDLLVFAGFSQAELADSIDRSASMICQVLTGDAKSEPVQRAIYETIKTSLGKTCPWGYDTFWDDKI